MYTLIVLIFISEKKNLEKCQQWSSNTTFLNEWPEVRLHRHVPGFQHSTGGGEVELESSLQEPAQAQSEPTSST